MIGSGSLLFNLAPYTKIPYEDIATLALRSVVEESPALRSAFTKVLCDHLYIPQVDNICEYRTQVTGNKLERPDVVGFDGTGKEVLICEAKFYAGLTENQPDTYLERLRKDNGKGLVFLCPNNRIHGLWKQLAERDGAEPIEGHDDCVSVQGVRMGIVGWEELLETLLMVSERNSAEMRPDIQELKVYCEQMIAANTFIPFASEDLGADVPASMERYYTVMDRLRDLLFTKKEYGITQRGEGKGKGSLHSQPQAYGDYYIYMRTNEFCTSLYFDKYAWRQSGSTMTPFWLEIKNLGWKQDESVMAYLHSLPEEKTEKSRSGSILIALETPIGLTLEETVQALCNQVLYHIDRYTEFKSKIV